MGDTTDTLTEAEPKRHSLLVELVIRLVKEKPLGTFGAVVVVVMLFIGIFAETISPYGRDEIHLQDALSPPSAQYILGTDVMGRDLLTRIIHGARISMIVGLVAAGLHTLMATVIGTLCGFFGGKFDTAVQRFVDAVMCFPSLFLYLTVMALLGRGLVQVILVLGITRGIRGSRVIRSAVISIKENVYLEAANAIGCPPRRILLQHILPNIMAPIIIVFSLSMGGMIISEASLSFLGFGIPPPTPSWGGMISGQGRSHMLMAPWLALWPGLALSFAVFSINMLGDGIRDILDPRLRGGLGRYGRAGAKEKAKRR